MLRLSSGAAILLAGLFLSAGAADNLVLNDGDDLVYGAETVAVGAITYPCKAGTVPARASLTLNGTTLSSTSLSASNNNNYGSDSDLILNAGAAMTVAGGIWYASCTYGRRVVGRIRVTDSSFTAASSAAFGCSAYYMNEALFELAGTNAQFRFTVNKAVDFSGRNNIDLERSTLTCAGPLQLAKIGSSVAGSSARGFTNDYRFVSSTVTCTSTDGCVLSKGLPANVLISDTAFTVTRGAMPVGGSITTSPALTAFDVRMAVTNGASLTVGAALTLGVSSINTTHVAVARDSSVKAATLVVGSSGAATLVADDATVTGTTVTLGSQAGSSGALALRRSTLAVKTLAGGSGTSALTLESATIRLTASGGTLFGGIGTVSAVGGLTIDTAGYYATITRSLPSSCPITVTGGGIVYIADGVTVGTVTASDETRVVNQGTATSETVSQASGSKTDSASRVRSGNSTIVFDVASGASLKVTGQTRAAKIDKRGGGLLTLDNASDVAYDMLYLTAGTLATGYSAPSEFTGIFAMTNRLSGSPATPPVILKNDAALTLNLANYTPLFTRPFIKRGAGTLTLMVYSQKKYDPSLDWSPFTAIPNGPAGGAPTGYQSAGTIDFGDGTTTPTTSYTSINVAEGRMVIDETHSSITQWAPMTIGNPQSTCAAQPELLLQNGQAWSFGCINIGPAGKAGTSAIKSPKLILRNFLLNAATYISAGSYSTDPEMRPVVSCSNSFIQASYYEPCGGYAQYYETRPFAEHVFEHNSALYVWYADSGSIRMRGPSRVVFDNSEFAAAQLAQRGDGFYKARRPMYFYYHGGATTNTFEFVNGSKWWSAGAATPESSGWIIAPRQTFIFDNGILEPGTTADTFTYNFDDRITGCWFEARGTGLVMTPAANQTFTLAEKLHGEGGFVNRGEGRVVLKNGYVDYTGVTCAENPTSIIDFDGATLTNMTLTGAGSFRNGTLIDPQVNVSFVDNVAVAQPTLDVSRDLELEGTVTFDFGTSEIKAVGGSYPALAVASYTGGLAPDLTHFKLKATDRYTGGIFTAADGTIYCRPHLASGLFILFR